MSCFRLQLWPKSSFMDVFYIPMERRYHSLFQKYLFDALIFLIYLMNFHK
uniref:Uncharacterized protein n=1 Tax=Rhizophora mucronata TaxID=61149 RepID=A0A2P2QXI5_RHIMU